MATRAGSTSLDGSLFRSSVGTATSGMPSAASGGKVAIAGTDHFGVKGVRRLIWELEPMGVELVVSPGVMDVARSRMAMCPIAGLPLLYIDKPQYRAPSVSRSGLSTSPSRSRR